MKTETIEDQVQDIMDHWDGYFDGYVCCSGFGCSCNGTENETSFRKELKQALLTAEKRGEVKFLTDDVYYRFIKENGHRIAFKHWLKEQDVIQHKQK